MKEKLTKPLLVGAEQLDLKLTEEQLESFYQYYQYLIKINQQFNLTAIVDPEEVAVKHFLDSLTLIKFQKLITKTKMIDVGTGAGFPGVVLKIFQPGLGVTLLDSLQKRVTFLNNLVEKLQLTNIQAIHGRAEEMGQKKEYRQQYDLVVSRAVANLAVLAELCLPLLKKGGTFIAMKGPKAREEIKQGKNAVQLLGGEIASVEEFKLPIILEDRTLIKITKIKTTPAKYPRRPGLPSKSPLN